MPIRAYRKVRTCFSTAIPGISHTRMCDARVSLFIVAPGKRALDAEGLHRTEAVQIAVHTAVTFFALYA